MRRHRAGPDRRAGVQAPAFRQRRQLAPVGGAGGSAVSDPSTRDRVTQLLLERGATTAAQLGHALGLSPAAIRRHLDAMLAEGDVLARDPAVRGHRGRGRPAKVFLLFDTGHAYFGGAADPVALLKKHLSRVVHVHCKDVRAQVITTARNDGWSFLNGVINGTFTVPGDGVIDFDAVLTTLKNAGYEGWLVVEAEQDPAVAPSYQYRRATARCARSSIG